MRDIGKEYLLNLKSVGFSEYVRVNEEVGYGVLLLRGHSQVGHLLTDCKGDGISVFRCRDAVPGLIVRASQSSVQL